MLPSAMLHYLAPALNLLTLAVVVVTLFIARNTMSNVSDIKQGIVDLGNAVGTIATDVAALEALVPGPGSEPLSAEDAATIKTGLQGAVKALQDANAAAQSVIAPPAPLASGDGSGSGS